MPKITSEQNKAIVLEAFDTLFNKREYATAERYWSPDYVQHSAHMRVAEREARNKQQSVGCQQESLQSLEQSRIRLLLGNVVL